MRGTRRYVVSILLVALVLGGLMGVTAAFDLKPRLGLDLQGGLSVTLTAPEGTRTDILDQTVSILRNRVDRAGVAEPEISREGSNNILIQLPGTEDRDRLLNLIGQTAQLQFRQVQEVLGGTTATVTEDPQEDQEAILPLSDGTLYRLGPAALTGADVRDAAALVDPQGNLSNWQVSLRFDREGAQAWEEFTGRLACLPLGDPQRQVAIILDNQVESAPQIGEEVQCNEGIGGGDTVISGGFSEDEAKDLALVLTTGALPVELERSEVREVSATLGRDSLRAGLLAGALGLGLVMLYVLFYYRSLGLQTWIGLATFGAIIYGLIVVLGEVIGWSLTLSGIAGLIVSIGIATDSYIVFFERIKEEVHEGRRLSSSVDRGFGHAWKTLRAANFVTILAAISLYFLAVGPVRGFALALGMATLLDLLLTYTETWPVAALMSRSKLFGENRFVGMRRALEGGKKAGTLASKLYRSEFKIDFMGRRRLWALMSAVLITISVVSLIPAVKGLSFGIDFKGGAIFRAPVDEGISAAEVRSDVREAGFDEVVVQIVADPTGRRIAQVQTGTLQEAERDTLVGTIVEATGADRDDVAGESVGEKWGRQITTKALRGLGIFLVLVILYLTLRLELKMAFGGIAALLHDLLITAGIYALVGFEVTPATVIATLTIMGYSLYDTVVVYDKIRENAALPSSGRKPYAQIVNESVNQVLMRSINTSLTTLLPVGSLLFVGSILLGADTLQDLALALFVGIAVGTYSSIFVAAPLVTTWKEKEPRYSSIRARALSRDAADEDSALPDEEPESATEESGASTPAQVRSDASVRVQHKRQTRSKRKKRRK